HGGTAAAEHAGHRGRVPQLADPARRRRRGTAAARGPARARGGAGGRGGGGPGPAEVAPPAEMARLRRWAGSLRKQPGLREGGPWTRLGRPAWLTGRPGAYLAAIRKDRRRPPSPPGWP